jgi:hypothetical protein
MTTAASGTEQAKALELLLTHLHRASLYEIARELDLDVPRTARVAQLRWTLRHRASFEQVFALMNALERRQLCRGLGLPPTATEEALEAGLRAVAVEKIR